MLTLYRIEKMKELSMNFLSEMNDRKERKKVEKFSKQMCEEMARYVVRRQLTSYLHPNTASAPSDSRQTAATETSPNHRERPINY